MKLRSLMMPIVIALSILTISGCQSGPSYDRRPMDSGSYGSGGGSSGY